MHRAAIILFFGKRGGRIGAQFEKGTHLFLLIILKRFQFTDHHKRPRAEKIHFLPKSSVVLRNTHTRKVAFFYTCMNLEIGYELSGQG